MKNNSLTDLQSSLRKNKDELEIVWSNNENDNLILLPAPNGQGQQCYWKTDDIGGGYVLYTSPCTVVETNKENNEKIAVEMVSWQWVHNGERTRKRWEASFSWYEKNGPMLPFSIRPDNVVNAIKSDLKSKKNNIKENKANEKINIYAENDSEFNTENDSEFNSEQESEKSVEIRQILDPIFTQAGKTHAKSLRSEINDAINQPTAEKIYTTANGKLKKIKKRYNYKLIFLIIANISLAVLFYFHYNFADQTSELTNELNNYSKQGATIATSVSSSQQCFNEAAKLPEPQNCINQPKACKFATFTNFVSGCLNQLAIINPKLIDPVFCEHKFDIFKEKYANLNDYMKKNINDEEFQFAIMQMFMSLPCKELKKSLTN